MPPTVCHRVHNARRVRPTICPSLFAPGSPTLSRARRLNDCSKLSPYPFFIRAIRGPLDPFQADYSCEFVFIRGLKSGLLSVLPA